MTEILSIWTLEKPFFLTLTQLKASPKGEIESKTPKSRLLDIQRRSFASTVFTIRLPRIWHKNFPSMQCIYQGFAEWKFNIPTISWHQGSWLQMIAASLQKLTSCACQHTQKYIISPNLCNVCRALLFKYLELPICIKLYVLKII